MFDGGGKFDGGYKLDDGNDEAGVGGSSVEAMVVVSSMVLVSCDGVSMGARDVVA